MRPYNKQQQKGNTSPHHTHKTTHARRSKNKPDKIQKEKITRVHYPVLTQHTHTTRGHQQTATTYGQARNNNHVPSQTPNNAPTHPKTHLCQPHTTHHHTLTHDDCDAARTLRAQASHPPTKTKQSTHTGHRPGITPTQKTINSLERR